MRSKFYHRYIIPMLGIFCWKVSIFSNIFYLFHQKYNSFRRICTPFFRLYFLGHNFDIVFFWGLLGLNNIEFFFFFFFLFFSHPNKVFATNGKAIFAKNGKAEAKNLPFCNFFLPSKCEIPFLIFGHLLNLKQYMCNVTMN